MKNKDWIIFALGFALIVSILFTTCNGCGNNVPDPKKEQLGEQIDFVDSVTKDSLRVSQGHVKALQDSLRLVNHLLKFKGNKTTDAKRKLENSIVAVAIDSTKSDDCAELLENCTDYTLQVEQEKLLQENKIRLLQEQIDEEDSMITILTNSNERLKKVGHTAVELFGATYQAYEKAKKPKKIGIGVQLGSTLTISKDFIVKPKPYIGVGISYNFIRL